MMQRLQSFAHRRRLEHARGTDERAPNVRKFNPVGFHLGLDSDFATENGPERGHRQPESCNQWPERLEHHLPQFARSTGIMARAACLRDGGAEPPLRHCDGTVTLHGHDQAAANATMRPARQAG